LFEGLEVAFVIYFKESNWHSSVLSSMVN